MAPKIVMHPAREVPDAASSPLLSSNLMVRAVQALQVLRLEGTVKHQWSGPDNGQENMFITVLVHPGTTVGRNDFLRTMGILKHPDQAKFVRFGAEPVQ